MKYRFEVALTSAPGSAAVHGGFHVEVEILDHWHSVHNVLSQYESEAMTKRVEIQKAFCSIFHTLFSYPSETLPEQVQIFNATVLDLDAIYLATFRLLDSDFGVSLTINRKDN